MKDKPKNKNVLQENDHKNPTPCPFLKGAFKYMDTLLFGVLLLLGFVVVVIRGIFWGKLFLSGSF